MPPPPHGAKPHQPARMTSIIRRLTLGLSSYIISPGFPAFFPHMIMSLCQGGSTQLRFQPRYGGYLATASDNVVSILDVETQTCVRRFESHTKGVDSVCWDPTGEYVVSVSEDSVKVWSLNDESFVNELNCSGRKFTSCTFHPTYPSLLIIGCYQDQE
ncbi:transcriptional corepressor LEUNIG-like isoform X3 [Miscanthus floridulus]|uniref:transcriptional corepressor LEUNIG-like isoform X3 n=1 Tax=Miscanthus floridulus TaxID=154761 RepID=UPI00345A7F55